MSVKVSPGKVNTDQFNMVAGSITLSTLLCSSFPSSFSHPHLSFCNLLQSFFFSLSSLGLTLHVQFQRLNPFMVSCSLMTIFTLLPHPPSSRSPCLFLACHFPHLSQFPITNLPLLLLSLSLSLSLTPPHPTPHPRKPLHSC